MKIKNYFFQIVNQIFFWVLAIPSGLGFIPATIYLENFDRPSWTLFFLAIFFSLLTYFWIKLLVRVERFYPTKEKADFDSWETPFWKIIPGAVLAILFWFSVMTWFYLFFGLS